MTDTSLLVNGYYPLDYFTLDDVTTIQYPDVDWWASKSRYAAESPGNPTAYLSTLHGGVPSSDILEIDFGRVRQINYLNFDILRTPVTITVEYDVISANTTSSDPAFNHTFVAVQPLDSMPFDGQVAFDANTRNPWFNASFYFTDPKGNMVNTRYLRITVTRQDVNWPLTSTPPFQWPIFISNLRVARYVNNYLDTIGPLLTSMPTGPVIPFTSNISSEPADPHQHLLVLEADGTTGATKEMRQKFAYPTNAKRGAITPNMLGFGILVQTNPTLAVGDNNGEVSYAWSVWDVTSNQTLLYQGIESNVVNDGTTWIDFYLPEGEWILGNTSSIFELRVKSTNPIASNSVYTQVWAKTFVSPIPGTLNLTYNSPIVPTSADTRSVVMVGSYIEDVTNPSVQYLVSAVTSSQITLTTSYLGQSNAAASYVVVYPMSLWSDASVAYVPQPFMNMSMRVWADIADTGEDVLGNSYRYAVHLDSPDFGGGDGWISAPQPSPNAVEALYFDVRSTITGQNGTTQALTVIDAIQISPRTPGVYMQIYYAQMNLTGSAPLHVDEWDNLVWTPINQTYILQKDQVFVLPQQIRASYLKLEFTNLRPLPFNLPDNPPLPVKTFRRYPTWIETLFNNSQYSRVVQDWFVNNQTPVTTQVLESLSDPIQEFDYEQRSFLTALAQGQVSASNVNSTLIDTSQSAIIDPTTASRIFISTPSQYQSSLLLSVDQNSALGQAVVLRNDPNLNNTTIEGFPQPNSAMPFVSTVNGRVSESYSFLINTPMRFTQTCRHVYAIDQAQFNKKAYFVGIDDVNVLRIDYTAPYNTADIQDILYDDQMLVYNTWQADTATQIPDGSTVYVSYQIGDFLQVTDEPVKLNSFEPVALKNVGGPAWNITVYAAPGQQSQQYILDQDYDQIYTKDALGNRVNEIVRSSLGNRLIAPKVAIDYVDTAVVSGHAFIPSAPIIDAGVSHGSVSISAIEGILRIESGTVTATAGVSSVNVAIFIDSNTASGSASLSAVDLDFGADVQLASGSAAISSINIAAFSDSNTAKGQVLIISDEVPIFGEGIFGAQTGTFGRLGYLYTDSGTVSGTASPSAIGSYDGGGNP